MRIYKCDKCEKEIPERNLVKIKIGYHITTDIGGQSLEAFNEYCPDCANEFKVHLVKFTGEEDHSKEWADTINKILKKDDLKGLLKI